MSTRPSPGLVVAIIALVLALGGTGIAATSSTVHKGRVKPGNITIEKVRAEIASYFARHRSELRGLSGSNGTNGLNGTNGTNGTNGANGATNVTSRETDGNVPLMCTSLGGGSLYVCSGSATLTASCNAGERATGGGYARPTAPPGASGSVTESHPNPVSGQPTGWTVTASITATSAGQPASGTVPVYAVCAAP